MSNINLIVGYGDIGERIAFLLLAKQQRVIAIARHSETHQTYAGQIEIQSADLDIPQSLPSFTSEIDCIFFLAPTPQQGQTETRVENFLQTLAANNNIPRKILYISTTGVYGDCGGRWIDEDEPVKPISDRAIRRLDAEKKLCTWCGQHSSVLITLRVSGIYGPGRLPIERIRQGMLLVNETEAPPSNRIHSDDLAQICVAAAEKITTNSVFNVADGSPSSMTDYFSQVAEFAGLPQPPQLSWEEAQYRLSPQMLSFLKEPKRIKISKIINELGFSPQFPNLAQGLPHSS